MYGTHITQNYVLIATIGIAAWKTLKKYLHDMKIPRKIFRTHEKMLNSQPIQSKAMYSENPIKSGCIEVICGSMFSGKTEELIRRLKRAQFANQKIEIFKPAVDKRYSDMDVVSHDLHSIPCTPVKDAAKMLECSDETQVIGIDEAQFFGENLIEVAQILADKGKRVIVAGLDTDYMGKPFGPIPGLMAIAEDVQKVHAICVKCGNLANHSHRLSKSHKLVLLGEKDIYEPLCRQCYNEAMAQENKESED